jgi:hypothetical protein
MTMSTLFNRAAIVPMWLLVFGLFVVFQSPMTFATGVVAFLVAGVVLTIMLVAWKERHTLAPMMTAPPPLAMVPSAEFVPNSWPNSGYRNSRRRGARGKFV